MNRQFTYGSASTTSEQIRQEIQRFESVHPCIYAIYDLIDAVPDAALADQIRQNVVCIEGNFNFTNIIFYLNHFLFCISFIFRLILRNK